MTARALHSHSVALTLSFPPRHPITDNSHDARDSRSAIRDQILHLVPVFRSLRQFLVSLSLLLSHAPCTAISHHAQARDAGQDDISVRLFRPAAPSLLVPTQLTCFLDDRGAAICIGGPALVVYVSPTEEELFKVRWDASFRFARTAYFRPHQSLPACSLFKKKKNLFPCCSLRSRFYHIHQNHQLFPPHPLVNVIITIITITTTTYLTALPQKYNPELQKRSLENRHQRQQDFDDYVTKLKEYSKSDKPSMFTLCSPPSKKQLASKKTIATC